MTDQATTPDFRDALSRFPAGVTVVTTTEETDEGATPVGFTASSFCSVSLDPPLILVCLARTANCYPVFAGCGCFAVSILTGEHTDLAARFATKRADKFDGGAFTATADGLPAVDGALCVLECATEDVIEAGDHVIMLGRVNGVDLGEGTPVVYFDRAFHQLHQLM